MPYTVYPRIKSLVKYKTWSGLIYLTNCQYTKRQNNIKNINWKQFFSLQKHCVCVCVLPTFCLNTSMSLRPVVSNHRALDRQ